MRSRARVSASFYKAFERMRRALRINPGAVFFVYIKRRRRPRRDSGPTITLSGQKTVSDRRWLQIDRSLPRFWKKASSITKELIDFSIVSATPVIIMPA